MASQSHGVFLYSLDAETGISAPTVSEAIIFQSLFSRQVCLNESHVLDNRAVWDFFESNKQLLLDMLRDRDMDEVPIIGLCSRAPSIGGMLDLWLGAKTGLPNYFTSLSPEQNDNLQRKPYPTTKEGRQKRLYKVEPCFKTLVTRLEDYFQALSSLTFVERTGNPDQQLYPRMSDELRRLELSGAKLSDEDKQIRDSIAKAIDIASAQTRDRLHKAIYGGTQPRYYKGHIRQHRGTAEPHAIKDEWRFYVNSIYSYNLAASLNVRPVLNTGWWPVGQRWLSEQSIRAELKLRNVGTLELPVPLYRDFLTLEFAVKFRKMPKFRESVSKLDAALASGDSHRLERAKKEHLSFLSQQFAKHLEDKGEGRLVGVTRQEFWISAAEKASGPLVLGGPVLTFLLTHGRVPPESTAELGHAVAETISPAFCLLANGLISVSPRGFKNKRLYSPDFKSLIVEIDKRSGV